MSHHFRMTCVIRFCGNLETAKHIHVLEQSNGHICMAKVVWKSLEKIEQNVQAFDSQTCVCGEHFGRWGKHTSICVCVRSAKFRRQDEIEEEEEDGSSTDRKEMTWKDFLNEE